MNSSGARHIRLEPGCVHHFYAGSGTCLRIHDGSVIVREAPAWLAGTLVPMEQRLAAGQGHVAARRGWMQLQALSPATLTVLSPQENARDVLPRLFQGLKAWVRMHLRRRLGYGYRSDGS